MLSDTFIKRAHLFTHAGCMDGSAAAILFKKIGGRIENIHYVNAGRVEHALEDFQHVRDYNVPMFLVDICPQDKKWVEYLEYRPNVWVFDHHSTAEPFAGKMHFHIAVGNTACGSEFFRQWLVKDGFTELNSEAYRRFCGIIDDHDRWLKNIPFSTQLPVLFAFTGQKFFVAKFSNVEERFKEEKDHYWDTNELWLYNMLLEQQDRLFKNVLTKFQVLKRNIDGQDYTMGYIINSEVNNSELLNQYLLQHPEVDAACQINFDLQKVSFRSRKNGFDVAKLAKAHGGGGHVTASGHPLPRGLIESIIEEMHVSF